MKVYQVKLVRPTNDDVINLYDAFINNGYEAARLFNQKGKKYVWFSDLRGEDRPNLEEIHKLAKAVNVVIDVVLSTGYHEMQLNVA